MSQAMNELSRSVFSALAGDERLTELIGSKRIFDRVPSRVPLPYVVLGRSTISDWSTATEQGEAIVFFLHVWSNARNRNENNSVQDAVRDALADEELSLDGFELVALRFQLSETRRDRVNGHVHSILRFRALVEPISN